jgi:hypothetical protein
VSSVVSFHFRDAYEQTRGDTLVLKLILQTCPNKLISSNMAILFHITSSLGMFPVICHTRKKRNEKAGWKQEFENEEKLEEEYKSEPVLSVLKMKMCNAYW